MTHYIEITLLPNEEVSLYFLWSRVFSQLHLAMVENKRTIEGKDYSPVGVSFSEYRLDEHRDGFFSLGAKLRLFGSQADLTALRLDHWLARLLDYVHKTAIEPVPNDKTIGFVTVARYRPNANNEALARRRARRKGESFEEALKHFETRELEWKNLPFVQIKSETTQKLFSLCIDQKTAAQAQKGFFSLYGLSGAATVPHW
jgi:CRISPR-associated endonuclease Csy4